MLLIIIESFLLKRLNFLEITNTVIIRNIEATNLIMKLISTMFINIIRTVIRGNKSASFLVTQKYLLI